MAVGIAKKFGSAPLEEKICEMLPLEGEQIAGDKERSTWHLD